MVIDSHSSETPFLGLDANGNPVPVPDDDLVVAYLDYRDNSGGSQGAMEGFSIELNVDYDSKVKIWDSQEKLNELTHAVFTINEFGVARWQPPVGEEQNMPTTVYLEGIEPGTAVISMVLVNNQAQPVNNDQATVTPIRVNLTIHNGQSGPAVAENIEVTLGAFTVPNLNDTDNDDKPDNDPNENGVAGEVDLMKLILHKPDPFLGGTVLLSVPNNAVRLWSESTKENEIVLDAERTAQFDLSAGDKTIWVEATDASLNVADIEITMGYLGFMDTVSATGIWTSGAGMLTGQLLTTATGGSNNQITLVSTAGFAVGFWVHVFDNNAGNDAWEHYKITAVNAQTNTLTLDDNLRTTINGGEIVRSGYWGEVDKAAMLDSFEERASGFGLGGDLVDGAMLGLNSHFYNSMEMELTLSPAGIGEVIKNHPESGIVVDITRQKEERGWRYAFPGAQPTPLQVGEPEFPSGDVPNDDGPNDNQKDEDTDPFVEPDGSVSDDIYVRDMPGQGTENTGGWNRWVYRWNFIEFVRIKLDGTAFQNQNDLLEGSRASDKYPWHSRLDLVDNGTGVWKRNPQAPQNGNSIYWQRINLGNAP